METAKDFRAHVVARRHGSADTARPSQCHVLIVDDLVPDPLFGFGFPRIFAMVQSLVAAGHRVSVYPMWSSMDDLRRMNELFGDTVLFHPGEGERGLRRLLWMQGQSVDLLFISRPKPMQAFVDACWTPASPPLIVYDAETVITSREALRRALLGIAWSAEEEKQALQAEFGPARHARLVTAVSRLDAERIAALLDVPVVVLSHPIVAQASANGFAQRRDLLFVGRLTGSAEIYPNVDSVLWFAREVMPHLDRLIGPDYVLHLVGLVDAPEVMQLASDRIVVHGPIDDLSPFYEESRLFIAPTRFAAGVPLKVVETMGQGLPCVTTPVLAEQLAASGHGFAHDPSAEGFARRCAELYTNPVAWDEARRYGLDHAQRFFSRTTFDDALETLVARASARPR